VVEFASEYALTAVDGDDQVISVSVAIAGTSPAEIDVAWSGWSGRSGRCCSVRNDPGREQRQVDVHPAPRRIPGSKTSWSTSLLQPTVGRLWPSISRSTAIWTS
jgi:hypothetical protein